MDVETIHVMTIHAVRLLFAEGSMKTVALVLIPGGIVSALNCNGEKGCLI